MPLRNEDKDWIRGEIRSALGTSKPQGWRKLVFVLRELGPLASSIAIVVTLLGITAAAIYHAVADVQEEATFRTHTGDRLDKIESTLALLQAQITSTKYSGDSPQELKKHSEELKAIKTTLASASRNVPNFWPVSFAIITLASQATSDVEIPDTQSETVFDNVTSSLGGIGPIEKSRVVLKNLVEGMIFKNSMIRFDPSVRLVNDVFVNCVFIFPAVQVPPKSLQEIGDILLTSDLSSVTVKSS